MAGIFFIQKASCKVRVVPVPKIIWRMFQWVLRKSNPKLWRFISYVPYLFILEWKRGEGNRPWGYEAMTCKTLDHMNLSEHMEDNGSLWEGGEGKLIFPFAGICSNETHWMKISLAAFNWGFAGGFDFFYLPIDFETKKNKVPMLETHGDSDERGGVGSGFCQLSVSSLVKNVCWSLVLYTAPEVYFILGKNPAFPSSIRFYPINSYQRSYLGFLLFS